MVDRAAAAVPSSGPRLSYLELCPLDDVGFHTPLRSVRPWFCPHPLWNSYTTDPKTQQLLKQLAPVRI